MGTNSGSADPNPSTREWAVVDSYSTGGGILDSWRALGPWRLTPEEAHRDADHGAQRCAKNDPRLVALKELVREWYCARRAYKREPAAAGWLLRCEDALEDEAAKWMPESTGLDDK